MKGPMSWQMIAGKQEPVELDSEFDLMVADKVYPGHPYDSHCKCGGKCLPPQYSTDLEAAYEIVDKLAGEGFSFALWRTCTVSSVMAAPVAVFKKGVYPPDWKTDVSWPDGPEVAFSACAETPALAICLAAMKAKAGS